MLPEPTNPEHVTTFARIWLKSDDPAEAARVLYPEQNPAWRAALADKWFRHEIVKLRYAELKAERDANLDDIITKEQLIASLADIVTRRHVGTGGRPGEYFYNEQARLRAIAQIADMRGFIEKPAPVNINNNQTNIDNRRVMYLPAPQPLSEIEARASAHSRRLMSDG